MRKKILSLLLSMTAILLALPGMAASMGLHEVAKEILEQCTCSYQSEKMVKDQLVGRTILFASVLCKCSKMDLVLAVACPVDGQRKSGPKECALDDRISISESENSWPKDWPSNHLEQYQLKEENADGMGSVR